MPLAAQSGLLCVMLGHMAGRTATSVALCVALLGGCSDAPSLERAAYEPVPRSESGGMVTPEALFVGVLGGDPETGCLWLNTGTERTQLTVWHDTARTDFSVSPFEVTVEDRVIAREGDEVEMTGGVWPSGYEQPVPGCPASRGVLAYFNGSL